MAADAPAMPEHGAVVGIKLRIPTLRRIVKEPGTIVFVGAEPKPRLSGRLDCRAATRSSPRRDRVLVWGLLIRPRASFACLLNRQPVPVRDVVPLKR